jgi:hypothetical protein
MMGHQLETVHHYPYLVVELSEDLGWEIHIDKVTSFAYMGPIALMHMLSGA